MLREIIRTVRKAARYFVTQTDDGPAAALAALAADMHSDPDLLALRAQQLLRRTRDEIAPTQAERELLGRYIEQLPEREYQILTRFKDGRRCEDIARVMGMSEEDVRRSLARTYAGMREWMGGGRGPDDDGGGLSAPVRRRAAA